jgi:hypothetical protein
LTEQNSILEGPHHLVGEWVAAGQAVRPVTCIALIPYPYGIGEGVVRAYGCMRHVGISPAGYVPVDEPLTMFKPGDRKRALALLFAAGFDLTEVWLTDNGVGGTKFPR